MSPGTFVRIRDGKFVGMSGVVQRGHSGMYWVRMTSTGEERIFSYHEIAADERTSEREARNADGQVEVSR
jgi:hypothetical protein